MAGPPTRGLWAARHRDAGFGRGRAAGAGRKTRWPARAAGEERGERGGAGDGGPPTRPPLSVVRGTGVKDCRRRIGAPGGTATAGRPAPAPQQVAGQRLGAKRGRGLPAARGATSWEGPWRGYAPGPYRSLARHAGRGPNAGADARKERGPPRRRLERCAHRMSNAPLAGQHPPTHPSVRPLIRGPNPGAGHAPRIALATSPAGRRRRHL